MERGAGRTTEPSLEEARIFIADLFSRKKSDRWSCEEEHLLAEIEPTREQLDTVAAFYRAAADGTDQMLSSRKQKVVTLLRDFSGEVDRARQWRKKNGAPPRSEKKEPAGWRAWRDEKYPGAGGDSFFDLTADVQREFYADQQEAAS